MGAAAAALQRTCLRKGWRTLQVVETKEKEWKASAGTKVAHSVRVSCREWLPGQEGRKVSDCDGRPRAINGDALNAHISSIAGSDCNNRHLQGGLSRAYDIDKSPAPNNVLDDPGSEETPMHAVRAPPTGWPVLGGGI